jgi:hypothetical protein
MATDFPIYDKLVEQIQKNPPQSINALKIANTINNELPDEHIEILAALILHYEIRELGSVRFRMIPYGGTILGKNGGVLFSMTKFPPPLQQIVAAYISAITA